MDMFSGIIFVLFFIIIMVIIFSIGVASAGFGKKELVFIIIIGFILGGLGGYFFIEPIYEDTPYFVGNTYGLFSTEDESINLVLPSSSNVSMISSEILKLDGVNSISTNGFDLKTDPCTNSQQTIIKNHLTSLKEVDSYTLNNSFISVNLKEDSQSTATLGSLVSWLSQNAIGSEFAFIHLKVNVNPSSVTDIKEYLQNEGYTVRSVEGPVQDVINNSSNSLVSEWIIILITGIIGVIASILGIYAESIFSKFRKNDRDRYRRY